MHEASWRFELGVALQEMVLELVEDHKDGRVGRLDRVLERLHERSMVNCGLVAAAVEPRDRITQLLDQQAQSGYRPSG